MFHSLVVADTPIYSNTTDYIEEEAARYISLASQIGFRLAIENGMVIDSKNGEQIPINISDESLPESYEQKCYLIAAQMISWRKALNYNKNSAYRLPNFGYEDMTIHGRKKVTDEFEVVDMDKYIKEIEQLVEDYDYIDYIAEETREVKLEEEMLLIEIPENQQLFTHLVDVEKSENLHLVDGISEDDEINLKELKIKPNQSFKDEEVKIVVKKTIDGLGKTRTNRIGIYDSGVQYKELFGLSEEAF